MSTMATSGRCSSTASIEGAGIADRGHDLDSRLDEQPGQSLAQQGGVVRDHYPHGSTASRRVPPSAPGPTESRPPSAATRSDSPCSPLPRGSTPPTPWSRDDQVQRAGVGVRSDLDLADAGVLDGVRDALGDHEPGGALQLRSEPLVDDVEAHPHAGSGWPGPRSQRADRRPASAAGWRPLARSRSSWTVAPNDSTARSISLRSTSGVSLTRADWSWSAMARMRCWAPSWRSRSIRRRSCRCAVASRARDSVTCSTCRASSRAARRCRSPRQPRWATASTTPRSVTAGSKTTLAAAEARRTTSTELVVGSAARPSAVTQASGGAEQRLGPTGHRAPRRMSASRSVSPAARPCSTRRTASKRRRLKRRSTADLAQTYAGRAIPAPASVASTVGSCEVERDRDAPRDDHDDHRERGDHRTRRQRVGRRVGDHAFDVVEAIPRDRQPAPAASVTTQTLRIHPATTSWLGEGDDEGRDDPGHERRARRRRARAAAAVPRRGRGGTRRPARRPTRAGTAPDVTTADERRPRPPAWRAAGRRAG